MRQDYVKYVSLSVLGMLGLSGYILADTWFIARAMGADGLAALNFSLPLYCLINGTGLMIGIGGATRFTIVTARKRTEEANQSFTHALILGLSAGLMLTLTGIFLTNPLARLLGADSSTAGMTQCYLRTILCFAPCFILNNILLAYVRNDGDPRLSMAAMLTGSFANILLDYIFMFPLSMGMFGAAFATCLAPVLSLGILSAHMLRKKNRFHPVRCRIRLSCFGGILSLGLSSFVTELSSGVVLAAFNFVILGLEGNTGVAAYGIVANLALVATAVFTGIAQGIQPMASRAYGSGQREALKKILRVSVLLALALSACIYAGSNLWAGPIIQAFNGEGNIALASIAEHGLRIYFIGFFFAGINIVSAAYLSAAERQKQAFLISFGRGCAIILPLLLLLSALLKMNGVWLAFVGAELLTCFFALYVLK